MREILQKQETTKSADKEFRCWNYLARILKHSLNIFEKNK